MRRRNRKGRQTPVHEILARTILTLMQTMPTAVGPAARQLRTIVAFIESYQNELDRRREHQMKQAQQRNEDRTVNEELVRALQSVAAQQRQIDARKAAAYAGDGARRSTPLDSARPTGNDPWPT